MELVVEGLEETTLAASVRDAKSVCFLSSSCAEVKWIKKTRKTHNAESNTMVEMEFLLLKISDDYNHGTKEVNVASQKREHYRLERFMRKVKW